MIAEDGRTGICSSKDPSGSPRPCAWRLTTGSRWIAGNVKLLLPPRQSRGASLVRLVTGFAEESEMASAEDLRGQKERSEQAFREGRVKTWAEVKRQAKL